MTVFRKRRTGGFSLIELLVVIGALGIIMAALAPFLGNFLQHTTSGSLDGMLLQEGRWAIDLIDRDINYAVASSITITGGNVISFSLPNSANVISYSLVSNSGKNEVCRQALVNGTWRPLTDGTRVTASNLSFVRNLDNSVSVSFQLQATDRFGRAHSRTFTSRVYQMN